MPIEGSLNLEVVCAVMRWLASWDSGYRDGIDCDELSEHLAVRESHLRARCW
jgi:hypothetical protein